MSSDISSMDAIIENSDENRLLIRTIDKCDKYDYLIAVACGVIGGLIDIFLVGTPKDSNLIQWTDAQVDNAVKGFARISGWNPKANKVDNVASAIGFLEKKYKINYDQRHSVDVNNLFDMSTKNHHMMSLGHSPDVIGLFFSILNQFTSTATFLTKGQLVTVDTKTFELHGYNFIAKVFCGIVNWLGHLMSDVAGSSGSRGNAGRGAGLVMPFYELFGLCKFGEFNIRKDRQDLATVATRAFQEGYDLRFGLAMAIPVIITDLSIRLIWSLRRYFQYKKPLNECIPNKKHANLRVMLLFGNATLCVMDGIDAFVKSGGNLLAFFMRFNLIAWFRFVRLVLKEICIRLGMELSLHRHLEAYKRINEALTTYLKELEELDIEAFKQETEEFNRLIDYLDDIEDSEGLNKMLLDIFDKMGYDKPWQGDFNEHMSNRNSRLTFE